MFYYTIHYKLFVKIFLILYFIMNLRLWGGFGPVVFQWFSGGLSGKLFDCLSVCLSSRGRAARGRLQLHTYAHNMQTKILKALCYKAA